jgi:ribose 1,5-bisphosphokinase PhnN
VIVEETLHRLAIREPFFEAGERLFGNICVVEIAVTPVVAAAHLQKRASDQADHMAGRAMFEAFAALADPLNANLVVRNDGALDPAIDEVCAHLETILSWS